MIRSLDKWFPGYLVSILHRPRSRPQPCHLMFCLVDHFEPFRGGASTKDARGIVGRWAGEYPGMPGGLRDADGKCPRHTFFYPQEEYDKDCLDQLADICSKGYGEVEIHLHHRNDTADGLRRKLLEFRDTLRQRHGLLGGDARGGIRYGFIHGNWSLCNSRPDGDWCGVNEELGILSETGCYADFTFPSAPSPTQPRMVNAIYRSTDTPGKARAADRGVGVSVCGEVNGGISNSQCSIPNAEGNAQYSTFNAQRSSEDKSEAGNPESSSHSALFPSATEHRTPNTEHFPASGFRSHPSSLLLITGPLALDWRRRKWGILPKLENAAISGGNPPSPHRLDLWAAQHIHVQGRPDWVFVKVHTHGCMAENAAVLLGASMRSAHEYLGSRYNDGRKWRLHYVTAREMHNIVRAAEDGKTGDPGQFRDYEVASPPYCG